MRQLAVIVCVIFLAGCYQDKANVLYPKPPKCDTTNVSFAADVLPVLVNNCALSGCHNAEIKNMGFDFTSYEGTTNSIYFKRLMGAIRHEQGFSAMPKNAAMLDECSISKIARWVNMGAENN